jgi:NTP pyrophosphatase (non-canonical NTP hydrolase)
MITTFKEYQKEVVEVAISLDKFKKIFPNLDDKIIELIAVAYDGLGLGEAGEVQGKIKKIIRDNGGIITSEAKMGIMAELSDILWYIASICENLGIKMENVATYNIEKIQDRKRRSVLNGSGDNR